MGILSEQLDTQIPADEEDRRRRSLWSRMMDTFDLEKNGNPNLHAVRDIWRGSDAGDKAAIASSPVPIAGDVIGLGNDMRHWHEDNMTPGEAPWGVSDYALTAAGVLPFVPAGTALRAASKVKRRYKGVGHEPEELINGADKQLRSTRDAEAIAAELRMDDLITKGERSRARVMGYGGALGVAGGTVGAVHRQALKERDQTLERLESLREALRAEGIEPEF